MLFCSGFTLLQSQVLLHPNRGQWNENALYKVELDVGEMYIEAQGVTYNFFHFEVPHNHHVDEAEHDHEDDKFLQHVIKTKFLGSQKSSIVEESKVLPYYRNYFLGNDSSKWKTDVNSIRQTKIIDLYSGINLIYEGKESSLKYSFEVLPEANAKSIQIQYEGTDKIRISDEGELIVNSELGEIKESRPVAWTINSNGTKKFVDCEFQLVNNIVHFKLGNYNLNDTLIIDPELTFSTFTGATSDNWGFTACPDIQGNLFGGGIVFGTGYPVTAGVYDGTFNGGNATGGIPGFDISITKFNPTGTNNLYSTFIGGNGNETPNSIVTNEMGELFILAVTSSPNYPVSAGVFQNTFAGGPSTTQYLLFNGTDLAITRLSANGNALLASTYVGGSGNDGLNYDSNLKYNYGDPFRGEIIVDELSNVYFSSTTKSANFPVAQASGSLSGQQDAIYGKLDADLTSLLFCRYYGGTGFETGNSLQLSSADELYMTGGTTSGSLSLGGGGLNNSSFGNTDAYVVRLNSTTGAIINGTFMGTSAYDQGYFVQLDLDNNVYVMGQSAGNYPNIGGVYGIPNSGQFIHKLNQNLSATEWSTTIGSGNGTVQISPTAFLVSDCYDIYLSGWGGQTNSANSLATNSTSTGFPVTPDAYQSTTNGSNFYIAVLDRDAAYLKYATYIGGASSSSNHVDGGTSRFDKSGTMYHAVCGSCGSSSTGFTTTPGVWSPTSQSNNCNLAAFKFDLSIMVATIGDTDPFICLPNPVIFQNNSSNGNAFYWDFGDGNFSTDVNPSHVYSGPGDYTVTLVVIDTNNCYISDTTYFDITIATFEGDVNAISEPVCPGANVQLEASGGLFYEWSPTEGLNDATIANPIATVNETTLFQVVVSDSCGSDTLEVLVEVFEANIEIVADTIMCRGDTIPVNINLSNVQQIEWTPAEVFSDPFGVPTTISPYNSVTIGISGVTLDGCEVAGELFVQVDTLEPIIDLIDSVRICRGSSVEVTASGANTYEWSPDYEISSTTTATVILSPDNSMTYYVLGFNACGSNPDSVYVEVVEVYAEAGNDTIICPGQQAFLWASGGVSYAWTPSNYIYPQNSATVTAEPVSPTRFIAWVTDENGCTDTAGVFVDLFPHAFVQTSPDYYGFIGDPITISANGIGNGSYSWSPPEHLGCVNCQSTNASPSSTMTYTVTFVDENGCIARDDVTIYFDGIIYVPNTFTPDGNNFNNIFRPEGGNIVEFNMTIFNRWGELIFESNNFETGWDGTYGGKPSPDGTYIWVIEYKDPSLIPKKINGHVNLLR